MSRLEGRQGCLDDGFVPNEYVLDEIFSRDELAKMGWVEDVFMGTWYRDPPMWVRQRNAAPAVRLPAPREPDLTLKQIDAALEQIGELARIARSRIKSLPSP